MFDVIVLPGGLEGANAFANSDAVKALLVKQEKSERLIAVICASPIALLKHGIGLGKKITSHPSKREELSKDYAYSEDRVVADGQLITSRGPGTTFEFALAIVEKLLGKEKVDQISPAMLIA